MDTNQQHFDFGMIGLGTMGRNLLLNMSDHDIRGAGYDTDSSKIPLLEQEANKPNVKGFDDLKAFVQSIKQPRAIMMLVPAGKPVDDVIENLLPLLNKDDILIDGGNSYFMDTKRREEYLKPKGLHFFGMGISGGEEGARFGPSMMPGGDKAAYAIMKPILEAISAKVDNDPCVTYIGPGASGHFVKMVHNGIEYGLMQLIAETYDYLKHILRLDNEEIADIFDKWNHGRLQSFLLEITTDIFRFKEEGANHILLDNIKDEARAKGTGKWTSQVAMDLEVPLPIIDTAVAMRDLSKLKSIRVALAYHSGSIEHKQEMDLKLHLKEIEKAFYFSMVMTYAQGMHLLSVASATYEYKLDLASIARIWRGGCIIRSAFLNDIYKAFTENEKLVHLLLNDTIRKEVQQSEREMRVILQSAIGAGLSMPAYAASLSYYDMIGRERMTSNLIQAQRDYFGAHQYERINEKGMFHTEWNDIKSDNNKTIR
jgi:6-phosphogluconate dehydrogenase